MDTDDISVGHLLREQKFLLEACDDRRTRRQFRADDFQSYETIEFPVSRFVHCSHSAFAKRPHDLVATCQHIADLQLGDGNLKRRWPTHWWREGWRSVGQRRVYIREGSLGVSKDRTGCRGGKVDYFGAISLPGVRVRTFSFDSCTRWILRVQPDPGTKPWIPFVHRSPQAQNQSERPRKARDFRTSRAGRAAQIISRLGSA